MIHRRRTRFVLLGLAALSLTTVALGQTKGVLRHPDVIRMSVSGTSFYWTFTANQSGSYDAALSNAAANHVTVATGAMTLDSFNPDSAVLRIVAGGHTATAKGKVSGNNALSGDWSNDLGQTGTFTATWDAPAAEASFSHRQQSSVALTECEGANNCATPAAIELVRRYATRSITSRCRSNNDVNAVSLLPAKSTKASSVSSRIPSIARFRVEPRKIRPRRAYFSQPDQECRACVRLGLLLENGGPCRRPQRQIVTSEFAMALIIWPKLAAFYAFYSEREP
jgi:hypothetical protein